MITIEFKLPEKALKPFWASYNSRWAEVSTTIPRPKNYKEFSWKATWPDSELSKVVSKKIAKDIRDLLDSLEYCDSE